MNADPRFSSGRFPDSGTISEAIRIAGGTDFRNETMMNHFRESKTGESRIFYRNAQPAVRAGPLRLHIAFRESRRGRVRGR